MFNVNKIQKDLIIMALNTRDKNFKVSELPKISDSEIDNLDLLMISDKSKNGKYYTKQLSIK